MNRRNTVSLALLVIGLSACHSASLRPTAAVPQTSERSISSATQLLADSIAGRKSVLELERVRLLTKLQPWANQVKEADDKIFALDVELMRMPTVVATRVIDDVLNVLERRDAGLQLELLQLRTKFVDDSYAVKDAKEELLQIALRRNALQMQRKLFGSR